MSQNLFEAWGALQGSLARLGDAAVAYHEIMAKPVVWGDPDPSSYNALCDFTDAAEAHYEAVVQYRELTKGRS